MVYLEYYSASLLSVDTFNEMQQIYTSYLGLNLSHYELYVEIASAFGQIWSEMICID